MHIHTTLLCFLISLVFLNTALMLHFNAPKEKNKYIYVAWWAGTFLMWYGVGYFLAGAIAHGGPL